VVLVGRLLVDDQTGHQQRGGLYGDLPKVLRLLPFRLREIEELFTVRDIQT